MVALVDDLIDRNGTAPEAFIADDELALPLADRNHGVDDLDPGIERIAHEFARHDRRRGCFEWLPARVLRRRLAIERPPQRVDHPSEQGLIPV